MAFVLYYGAFWKSLDMQSSAARQSDVAKYECYAVSFWQGTSGLQALPEEQCSFIARSSLPPFHALPREYPLLALILFSLPLLAPLPFYQVVFALFMVLIAGTVYFLLRYVKGMDASLAFVMYLVVGCWATAEGRFDLVPSVLTLIALICAEQARWKWAFALLALATLFKFYPLVLLAPFLIAQQLQYNGIWHSWRRIIPLGVFTATCVGVVALSLLLSVEGTLAPLSYFAFRPIQIESPSASVLWLASLFGQYQLTYAFSYGSRNVFSPLSSLVGQCGTALLVLGLSYIFWLQWRGKIALPLAVLLTLLIVVTTGKVFSAQYLVWFAPLVACVGKGNWRWLIGWGSVSLVTTVIYPFLYERSHFSFIPFLPPLYPTIFVRNVLLFGFTIGLLCWARQHRLKYDV